MATGGVAGPPLVVDFKGPGTGPIRPAGDLGSGLAPGSQVYDGKNGAVGITDGKLAGVQTDGLATPTGQTVDDKGGIKEPDKEKLADMANQYTGERHNFRDFAATDPSAQGPSDFVGFNRFAGLNDETMRGIADKAMWNTIGKRSDAFKLLEQAQKEVTPDTPLEKTPSYEKFTEALRKAPDDAKAAVSATGNHQEDAIRQAYYKAQKSRDDEQDFSTAKNAGIKERTFAAYQAAKAKADADAAAAADAASKSSADTKAKQDAWKAQQQDVASMKAENGSEEVGPRRQGETQEQYVARAREVATRNARARAAAKTGAATKRDSRMDSGPGGRTNDMGPFFGFGG